MTTYYDMAEDVTFSRERARAEICKQHQHPPEAFDEFLRDAGDYDEYDAQAVLDWLGY